MSRQKEDLEKAIAGLAQQTIVKLNRVCRLRFKEALRRSRKVRKDLSSGFSEAARPDWC